MRSFLRTSALVGMATVTTVLLAVPASAAPTMQALAVTPSLNATIRLNNCSASLVRFPTSADTDRAMMLTNGHCFEGGFLSAGQVIQNRTSSRSGTLLNSAGTAVATVTADLLLYATMTNTDVSLYRLTQTIATIRTNTGISPLTISASHPADGISMFIPSGFHARIWNCSINGFVATMSSPDFVAEAKKSRLAINPMDGEALTKLVVNSGSGLSPEMIADIKKMANK